MATGPGTAHTIEREDFDNFRALIRHSSGIALSESKDALLTSRIARRMRQLGIDSHAAYYEKVIGDQSRTELQLLVDAVSTNVTSFFREPEHFEHLRAYLAKIAASGRTEVRLWSAACSTGEEPYSMAMVAREAIEPYHARVRILATDISTGALATAHQACYAPARVGKIPAQLAMKYLKRNCSDFEVSPLIRSMVTLSPINLSHPPFPMRGPFEVIFCRNVMIYFGVDTRTHLVAELERLLAPGGLLMLGHAESLAGIACDFKPIAPAVYVKVRG